MAGGINLFIYSSNNPINITDPFGLRPLTEGEKNALRFYFGASLNVDAIDLEESIHGGAWSPSGNNISVPKNYFKNSDPCEELDLTDPNIYSVFAHEALHVWQRQHGQSVTVAGFFLHFGRIVSLGAYDPYEYDYSITDPNLLLNEFSSGNVEQQGWIFQNYVYSDQMGYNTSRYDRIADYVYWR